MMRNLTAILLTAANAWAMLAAQTPAPAENVKFAKVAAPVTNQGTQGNRPAGEFYHATYTGAAWGDYDNDGFLDLYYSDRNTHVSGNTVFNNLYHNSGDGTFTRVLRAPFSSTAFSCPVWLDINRDGNLDLVISGVSNWSYGWKADGSQLGYIQAHAYLGDGQGDFTEIEDCGLHPIFNGLTGGKGHNWISAGDYDRDGYVDLLMTGFDDINRLGKEHYEDAMRVAYLYRNIGGERFELQSSPVQGDKPLTGLTDGSALMTDLDGDGWLDLLTTGYSEKHNSEGYIYWNNGDGTFSQRQPLPVWALTNASSSVADLDGDGLPDLVLTGIYVDTGGKYFYICKNNGDRTFTPVDVADTFEGIDGGQLAFGDVNHDGLTDILVGGHGSTHEHTTWLYVNQGNFDFAVNGAYYNDPFGKLGSFSRVTHGSHHLVDYDNDGLLDAWFLGWCNGGCGNGCLTELWHNESATKGVTPNVRPVAPTAISATVNPASDVVSLSWTPGSDEVTPTSALRYNVYVKNLADESCFMLIPANLLTGQLKVSALNTALTITDYQMRLPKGDYEWGVQTIDNGNVGSTFTTGQFSIATSGVATIGDAGQPVVTATRGGIAYRLNAAATVSVYNAQGMLVNRSRLMGSGTLAMATGGFYLVAVEHQNKRYIYRLVL